METPYPPHHAETQPKTCCYVEKWTARAGSPMELDHFPRSISVAYIVATTCLAIAFDAAYMFPNHCWSGKESSARLAASHFRPIFRSAAITSFLPNPSLTTSL
jgi:ABC-type spermidine/putrescine transport system permease subunit I